MVDNNNANDNGARRSRVAKRRDQNALQTTEAAAAPKAEKKTASREERASKRKKKRKKKHILLKVLATLVCLGLIVCIAGAFYVAKIIKNTPDIDTDDISSLLSQTSIIYDSDGKQIEKIYGDKNRTIITIDKIPENTQNAFIALEDKTFRTHHGFNIIRIFGAITQKFLHGGVIGGTSTITQQLARNLYLEDTMEERSIERKIKEAYYAYLLEQRLSKDEILEGYLNTVNFGNGFGIQAASKAFFNKSAKKLTLAESAALAAVPNAPSYYALVVTIPTSELTDEFKDKVLYTSGEYSICYNDRAEGRMKICLDLMLEQGLITQKQYNKAVKVKIKDIVHPSKSTSSNVTSYFADFVISEVINDFMDQYGYDQSQAIDVVYNKGVKIYTTLNQQAQDVIDKEFKDNTNFPYPTYYSTNYDGDIITSTGKVMLYKYDNFIQDETFTFKEGEYKIRKNGSILLYAGNRLRFYETSVNGVKGVSIELPKLFRWKDDGYFYITEGAYINVPEGYAKLTKKGNVIISSSLAEKYPDMFKKNDAGLLYTKDLTLKNTNIQPQAAMTIIDNKTGAVVAMAGGRGAKGKMLYNRAISTRQPGSSIKPIAVYSAALQKSFELQAEGQKYEYVDTGYDRQGTKMWGDYITAASIVVDEQMTVNGKEWPKNSNFAYTGKQTLRTALQQSINTCAVKILSQVGIDYAYQHALKFGLTTIVSEGAANDVNLSALGIGGMTNGVTTLEMASAYTTFVNDGVHKSYYCYDKVVDRHGKTILEPKKTETDVLDPGVAWIMRDILQTVVSQGIAGNARIYGETVGGKTGTTGSQRENCDIWFDGFTANYTASLWIGSDVNIGLSSQSPAAALLWSKIMSQIPDALGGTYSGRPGNVVTANVNGRTEYFTKGTEKNAGAGGKFTKVKICTETGLLATPECPHTKEISGFQADKEKNESMGDIPTTYCYLHNPDLSKYKVSKEHKKEAEKIIKEKEEKEAKEKAEKEAKEKAEKEAKEKAEKEAKEKAEKEAKEKAEKEAKEQEKAKQKAYNDWLKERENHKHWVIDEEAVYEDIVIVDKEAYDEQVDTGEVDENGDPIYETVHHDAETHTIQKEVSPEVGHWAYDKGYRDGDFKYP
ncbi:MAG: transglycosylase domain-containing protein [Firmicutes bacterium]|nr:transglycosylase domain-containing protein [Bacillota bacterium]